MGLLGREMAGWRGLAITEEVAHDTCGLGEQGVQSALGRTMSQGIESAGFDVLPRLLGMRAGRRKGRNAPPDSAYLSHTLRLLCPDDGSRKLGQNRTDPPQ